MGHISKIFGLWRSSPLFCLEYCFTMLIKLGYLDQVYNRIALSYVLLLFSGCMIIGTALHRNQLVGLSEYTLFGIWFLFLAGSQYLSPFFVIDNRIFRTLGKYSYPNIFISFSYHYIIRKIYTESVWKYNMRMDN